MSDFDNWNEKVLMLGCSNNMASSYENLRERFKSRKNEGFDCHDFEYVENWLIWSET